MENRKPCCRRPPWPKERNTPRRRLAELRPLETAELTVETTDDVGGSGANSLVYWEGRLDGERLLFVGAETSYDLWTLDADGEAELFLGAESFDETNAGFSPDGRWVVYASGESGKAEIYVRPYPPVHGPAEQISVNGGVNPVWSRNGREIFYREGKRGGGKVFAVSVDSSGDRLKPGRPIELFEQADGAYVRRNPIRSWDVAPDGRFLMIKKSDEANQAEMRAKVHPNRIRVVPNWFDELRERAPASR